MKLLFIHGINQQNYTSQSLLDKWSKILVDNGFDAAKLKASNPTMAFYGDLLHQLSSSKADATSMSANVSELAGMGQGELEFINEGLGEVAEERGFTNADIYAAAQRADEEMDQIVTAIPMSTGLGRFAVGVLRLLDEIAPPLRDTALTALVQANAYLRKPGARPAIDARVKPEIVDGDQVIVAHSLGTIVAFHLLRKLASENPNIKVPLLITVGSPLGVEAVKKYVDIPHRIPPNIARWENYFDRGDPVSLGKKLSSQFAAKIADFGNINNTTDNAHSIEGYLNQSSVQTVLHSAL